MANALTSELLIASTTLSRKTGNTVMPKVLNGCVSPETAYVIDDYPYGFRLRCKMRHWIETREGMGQRYMSQTSNPKKGDIWNKPKASTYHTMALIVLNDETGHAEHQALSWVERDKVDDFRNKYASQFDAEQAARFAKIEAALVAAEKRRDGIYKKVD